MADRSGARSRPRADAAEPVDGDVHDDARGWPGHGRELHIRPEVPVRELLQELGRAAIRQPCLAVDHEVLQ